MFIITYIRFYLQSLLKKVKDKKTFLSYLYNKNYNSKEINRKLVLYKFDFDIGDNISLYEILEMTTKENQFNHILIVENKDSIKKIKSKLSERCLDNLIIINQTSKKYIHYLLVAKYFVTNNNLPSFYIKKEKQTYIRIINHSALNVSKESFDIFGNTVRNIYMSDYLITQSSFMTHHLIEKYNLEGMYRGNLIEIIYKSEKNKGTEELYIYKLINKVINENVYKIDGLKKIALFNNKKKILIYPGNLAKNGITSSLFNLLENFDSDKYDVTLIVEPNQNLINIKVFSNTRCFLRLNYDSFLVKDDVKNRIIQNRGLSKKCRNFYPEKANNKEAQRLLANLSFDVAIDFSGYNYFWSKLILGSQSKKTIIFQHNDMFSEREKIIHGKKIHENELNSLFSIYYKFDRILSVSKNTMELNKRNLNEFMDSSQIGYSENTINIEKIKKVLNNKETHDNKDKTININTDYINIVTMGRLSPEKNQENLIIAFSKIVKEYPLARLYLLGEGVLKEQLKEKIVSLNLEKSVFLSGYVENPFQVIYKSDIFVLPSIYEGQPMVLLETLSLNMKVIATDITANKNVLGEDEKYGMLIHGTDVQAIYEGLVKMFNFEGVFEQFDYIKYNERAIEQFYKELEC